MPKKGDKRPPVATPQSVAAFAWLDKPDTKWDADGVFTLTQVFDANDDLSRLDNAINEAAKARWGTKVKPANLVTPFREGEEGTDFEGKVTLKAKSKFKPDLRDAKKNKLPGNVKIFSGDVVKSLLEPVAYESTETVREGGKRKTVTVYGVMFRLLAVQLIEKNSTGGNGYGDMFDEEDGYEGDDSVDDGEANEDADDDDGDF